MGTIAKHSKKLRTQYCRSAAVEGIVASAKHLARLVLASDELLPKHRKKMLSEVLWIISEADGKYSARYRTAEVVRLATEDPTSRTKIQHEHVFPRKKVIKSILDQRHKLLKRPRLLDELLDQTVACVVTAQEHTKLCNSKEGRQRYGDAKVPVLDMLTNTPFTT